VRSPGILAQEVAGAGVEPVARAAERRAGAVETLKESHQEKLGEHAVKEAEIQKAHEVKKAEAAQSYRDEQAQTQKDYAEKKAAYDDKVNKSREEWVRKAYESKGAKAEQAKIAARKETLERGQQEYGRLVGDNVESTHAAVRGGLDDRWNAMREHIGKDTPLNSVKLSEAVEEGRETLQGAPADLKVFNDLMNQMESSEAESIDTAKGTKPVLRPLTWDEGRTHYSALGDKLYSGELPGNVYRAVKKVREALDNELAQSAEKSVAEREGKAAGVKARIEYGKLKLDWKQYMDDWHDMRSMANGGSPLARVFRSADAGVAEGLILGKFGDRLLETFAKYDKQGASPRLMQKLRVLNEQAKALPKVGSKAYPPKLQIPEPPKLAEAKPPKQIAEPKLPPPPKEPKMPPLVDPATIRRHRLEDMAARPFRWYDLFPPYLMEHILLKSPKIREYISNIPRKADVEALKLGNQ
jgi:hypothetical protein